MGIKDLGFRVLIMDLLSILNSSGPGAHLLLGFRYPNASLALRVWSKVEALELGVWVRGFGLEVLILQ